MTLESKILTVIVLIWGWFLVFKFKTFDKMAVNIEKEQKPGKVGKFFISSTFFKFAYIFAALGAILVMIASK